MRMIRDFMVIIGYGLSFRYSVMEIGRRKGRREAEKRASTD
jgi:hypothetical protein